MDRRKKLAETDKRHVWHPFTQMSEWEASEPLIIEKGSGNYLIDVNGRRYLDGVSSLWVNVHGHRKKEIDGAIRKQLGKIAHSTLLGLGNVPSIELAERLVSIAPRGLTKVFYSDNGSTAVEIALKMAFQFWEQTARKNAKRKFVAFTGAYHGDTFGSMSVGEIDIFVEKYRPLLFEVYRAPYPYAYRCPVKDKPCEAACVKEFEKILKKHHKEIAACVIEPLFEGAAGMITTSPRFLKEVRRLTKKYNTLLIADEVATGFGRTGGMFACGKAGITPDFLCMAKGLTGGYLPLAATLTTDEVYRAFLGRYDEYRSFFHGHTYTGNPLGCAAALANLDIFEKEKTIEKLQSKIRLFGALLKEFKKLEHVGDVRHIGLVAGIELVEDKKTKKPYSSKLRMGNLVCMEARKHGLLIRPLGDTVVLMPPLSITERELKKIIDVTYACVREITER